MTVSRVAALRLFDGRARRWGAVCADRVGLFRVSGGPWGGGRDLCRRRGGASGEAGGGKAPFVGVGTGRGERELDAPRADADEAGELEKLEPDRAAGGLGELRVREADAPDRAEENIGERGEPEPELVGAHGRGRGAVGEQVALAFLDPVLHLAAGAIDLLVEKAAVGPGLAERGDDEARVGLALGPFRLADDAPPARPTVERGVAEVLEAAGGLAGRFASSSACASSTQISSTSRALRARPNKKSTRFCSHQAISASRAKPESARNRIRVRGQRARICPTIRAISSWPPALPSMFDGRSLAASRCRPQNT